jgi:hypothetical protein
MKKTILSLLLIFNFSLYAKSKETCYTVQLLSKRNNAKNMQLLKSKLFPQECKLMNIGNNLTVRCGCFEKYKEIKPSLPKYKNSFKNAMIVTTYKYRFSIDNNKPNSTTKTKHKTTKKQTINLK